MTLLTIQCQICDETIATAESTSLSVPMTGSMFGPPFPERMNQSLLTEAEWEYLRCPTCRNNPFLRNDEVLTPDGIHRIEPMPLPELMKLADELVEGVETEPIDTFITKFLCECCDPQKECSSLAGLRSHERSMRKNNDR